MRELEWGRRFTAVPRFTVPFPGSSRESPDSEGGRLTVELRHSPGLAAEPATEDTLSDTETDLLQRNNGPRLGPSRRPSSWEPRVLSGPRVLAVSGLAHSPLRPQFGGTGCALRPWAMPPNWQLPSSPMGLLDASVYDVPVAIVDTETTLTDDWPRPRRLIEVSVVRVEPRDRVDNVVFNTLVNPQRAVSGKWIHRIGSDDVRDAPKFEDIAGNLERALAGCVIAAYQVSSDISVIRYEFGLLDVRFSAPLICLRRLRKMLGLGARGGLAEACRAHGIKHKDAHTAMSDALAGARLWRLFRRTMRKQGLQTFRDLFGCFHDLSFLGRPLRVSATKSLRSSRSSRLKPRNHVAVMS